MENFNPEIITNNVALSVLIAGVIYAFYRIFTDYFDLKSRNARKAEEKKSLTGIVENLASPDKTTQVSAAIMLRRFMNTQISRKYPFLQREAISVIASTLKIVPTGVFQKTLADGLAYAIDISNVDLQRTNLQDCYLGRKGVRSIKMKKTDLFLSDLSYALIENVKGNAIFYRSILFCTQIKNSNLENSSFCEADLTHCTFKNVRLNGADFTNAINIPKEIEEHLVEDDKKHKIVNWRKAITTKGDGLNGTIFFSMPSVMNKADELLTKDYQRVFEQDLGYQVHYYVRDDYPCFGQLNKVREKIMSAKGMVVFGFKQTILQDATYRPGTSNEENWRNRWLSTPWNEIEVGMALMKGMPILLIKDPEIEMGVFDKNLSECFIATLPTTVESRKILQNPEIVRWFSKVDIDQKDIKEMKKEE